MTIASEISNTYSLSIIIDIGIKFTLNEDNIKIVSPIKYIKNILLCKIPIMVKSKYCVYKEDIKSELTFIGVKESKVEKFEI